MKNTFVLIFVVSLAFGCNQKKNNTTVQQTTTIEHHQAAQSDTSEKYFSINDFLQDQWKYLSIQSYVLTKTIKVGNKESEPSFVPLDKKLFDEISSYFRPSDISGASFKGKYHTTFTNDSANDVYNIMYESLEPTLFTKMINITMTKETQRITNVYIETKRNDPKHYSSQKLLYVPEKIVQIQSFSKTGNTPAVTKIISYKFPESQS